MQLEDRVIHKAGQIIYICNIFGTEIYYTSRSRSPPHRKVDTNNSGHSLTNDSHNHVC